MQTIIGQNRQFDHIVQATFGIPLVILLDSAISNAVRPITWRGFMDLAYDRLLKQL